MTSAPKEPTRQWKTAYRLAFVAVAGVLLAAVCWALLTIGSGTPGKINPKRGDRALAKIEELSLNDTSLGDEALEHLAGLDNLLVLSLEGTGVTPAAVQGLRAPKKLRTVLLDGRQVAGPGSVR